MIGDVFWPAPPARVLFPSSASWLRPSTAAVGSPPEQIIGQIGQIGIGHNHASAKMATLPQLSDHFEVVGVVEPSPEWRGKRGIDPAYRGLKWMTEEQLLNTRGLAAVARRDRCLRPGAYGRALYRSRHASASRQAGRRNASPVQNCSTRRDGRG